MTPDTVLDIMYEGLTTILFTAAPPLIMGLTVGVIFSIFQTVTSIQEPTLAFVPKIVAVLLALIIFGPYMMTNLSGFVERIFSRIPELLIPR